MIKICIVEDEASQAELLTGYLKDFAGETGNQIDVTWLRDGLDIVEEYKSKYDIILLDIQMKHMDGMTAAERIRKLDQDVIIIFITSTVQYAVQGYAVDALGYVLKPVPYPAFKQLIDKAVVKTKVLQEKTYIKVSCEDTQIKLDCNDVTYIESQRNNVIIHTKDRDYVTLGPLKKYEELLEGRGFSKCHNAYLINLGSVSAIQKEEVILVSGITLPISRARKKEFLSELTNDIL